MVGAGLALACESYGPSYVFGEPGPLRDAIVKFRIYPSICSRRLEEEEVCAGSSGTVGVL